MKLSSIPFEKIASGQKAIESRLFDEKRKAINVGDCIEFSNTDNADLKISTKVKAMYRCCTFEELFSAFPAEKFGGESEKDLLQEIRQFYSQEEENKLGVVGIFIERN